MTPNRTSDSKNPWGRAGMRCKFGQSATQAEASCKQSLGFLYLLPRWVLSQPSSMFQSPTPTPAPDLPASISIPRFLRISKVQLCLSLIFLSPPPNPAVMLPLHPLPSLNSLPLRPCPHSHHPLLTPRLLPFLMWSVISHPPQHPARLPPDKGWGCGCQAIQIISGIKRSIASFSKSFLALPSPAAQPHFIFHWRNESSGEIRSAYPDVCVFFLVIYCVLLFSHVAVFVTQT